MTDGFAIFIRVKPCGAPGIEATGGPQCGGIWPGRSKVVDAFWIRELRGGTNEQRSRLHHLSRVARLPLIRLARSAYGDVDGDALPEDVPQQLVQAIQKALKKS